MKTPARIGRPPLAISNAERLERRRASVAASVRRHRAGKKAAGIVTLEIELTAEQAAEFAALRKTCVYSPDDFAARALILGAKFCANMSQGKRPVARKRGTGGVVVSL